MGSRGLARLSALRVRQERRPGRYADGGGLYLQVGERSAKSWIFRYVRDGVERQLGLGPTHTIGLAEARELALECRKQVLVGNDPLAERRAARAAKRLAQASELSFRQCAEGYVAAHAAGWGNAKHRAQWSSTLERYVHPVFGDLPVRSIDTALVMKAIEPMWIAKTETASRVRGRIESVLDWATARGYRQGENPARWRGHLENLLPQRSKVQSIAHHAALPYGEIGVFMGVLRKRGEVAARALEFAILTCTRSSEAREARWEEFNLVERVWVVPATRMKMRKEHRVPLGDAAVALLGKMAALRRGDIVFPGVKANRPVGENALSTVLQQLGRSDLTVHGFRSTFRDWAGERTNFPREVAEMALAHAISDKVEAAYRRGDLFLKRRQLATAWERYCAAPGEKSGTVVSLAG